MQIIETPCRTSYILKT